MAQTQFYKLMLSKEQVAFLSSSRKLNRFECLMQMIELAVLKETPYRKETGFETTLQVGQLIMTETELSKMWDCSRNAASNLLDGLNRMQLVSSLQGRRTSVHTILCVVDWIDDNNVIHNPHWRRYEERTDVGVTSDTPPADTTQPNANSHSASRESTTVDHAKPFLSIDGHSDEDSSAQADETSPEADVASEKHSNVGNRPATSPSSLFDEPLEDVPPVTAQPIAASGQSDERLGVTNSQFKA
jgi:hypothetical protein